MSEIGIADPQVGKAEMECIADVLASGQLTDGETVREFEREFARYCSTGHGVATCNGTAALHAALEAVGIEPARGVITTPFTFVATANVIRLAGGVPVFADIDPETYTIDPHSVESILRDSPQAIDAILAVHLYGLPADMDHLKDLAETYDLALVEDAAQAHGARYEGEPIGSLSDVGCFSFYPTKNMTTGEGGMVVTDRADLAEDVRRFINHGRDDGSHEHVQLGHNYRMTDIAAGIGMSQLRRLPDFLSARRENAAYLTNRLPSSRVTPPYVPSDRTHAYNQYTVRCEDRDRVREDCDSRGIETGLYYPYCIPDLPAYEGFSPQTPHAHRASEEVLSLPVHPGLSTADLDEIADVFTEVETVRD